MLVADTAPHVILNFWLKPSAGEVRTAEPTILENLASLSARFAKAAATQSRGTAKVEDDANQIAHIKMSPWLADTMATIGEQRDYIASHRHGDVRACSEEILNTAQLAAALLSSMPPARRPQLSFDNKDSASFATATREYYMHLTVDEPNRLTWFAEVGGNEYFTENCPFDGRRLPEELRRLLSI
jgi:hypothetical protein